MKDPNEYNVRAVERALHILNCFDDENPERGISEIAQAVDLHKSTTHRIVTTLLNYGFLERTEDGQMYRLGLQLASLGVNVIQRVDARQNALPYMKELVEQWDETCDLSVFNQNQVFYLEVIQGNHALTIAASAGQRLPAHCTASGKLFLAQLAPDDLDDYLRTPLIAYTENTITSPAALRDEISRISEQGFSLDHEEFELGVKAVAASIRNMTGEMIAAMSILGPANRNSPERMDKITRSLLEKVGFISQRMGWKL